MVNIIWIVGAIVAVLGVAILIVPNILTKWLGFFVNNRLIYLPIIIRLIIGLLFLIYARSTTIPWVVIVFGLLITGAGVIFLFMPYRSINTFVQWWLDQPQWVYRFWALIALAMGGLLMYAGFPKGV